MTARWLRTRAYRGCPARPGYETLIVRGATIRIDAQALSPDPPFVSLAFVGRFSTATVASLTLLPASRYLLQFESTLVGDLFFSLENDGTLGLDRTMTDLLKVDRQGEETVLRVLPHRQLHSPIYGPVQVKVPYEKWTSLDSATTADGGGVQKYLGLGLEESRSIMLDRGYNLQRFQRGDLWTYRAGTIP